MNVPKASNIADHEAAELPCHGTCVPSQSQASSNPSLDLPVLSIHPFDLRRTGDQGVPTLFENQQMLGCGSERGR